MKRFARAFLIIDTINENVGRIFFFVIVLMMLISVMEVVMRYVFNSPTIWAWDVNGQLLTATVLLGGGYALVYNFHVRMDILYSRVSPRIRAVFDLVAFPLILAAFVLLTWQATIMAWSSWTINEHSGTYFNPPLYPLKIVLWVGAFLLLLQTISNYGRVIASLRKKVSQDQGEDK
jgi:TRAP-type mannitol/chloroaromatic compound transport system permease small subunit